MSTIFISFRNTSFTGYLHVLSILMDKHFRAVKMDLQVSVLECSSTVQAEFILCSKASIPLHILHEEMKSLIFGLQYFIF